MFRLFSLSLVFCLLSWVTAEACTPILQLATTEQSYEKRMEPFLQKSHRRMVDTAAHIVIGKIQFSERKQAHQLKISKTLKRPLGKKRKKRVTVTFKHIDKWGISYKPETALITRGEVLVRKFIPTLGGYGHSGSYFAGTGSCESSLHINPDAQYLIFANDDFEITSMLFVGEETSAFQNAIKNLVKTPAEPYGISFSLQTAVKHGNEIKLLQTNRCSPSAEYKILRASNPKAEMTTFRPKPIKIFKEEGQPLRSLSEAQLAQARKLGQENGIYRNAPARKFCQIGQKHLMLGQFISPRERSGQMIPEKNNYFDLSETAFEYHITPNRITFAQVVELLDDFKTTTNTAR